MAEQFMLEFFVYETIGATMVHSGAMGEVETPKHRILIPEHEMHHFRAVCSQVTEHVYACQYPVYRTHWEAAWLLSCAALGYRDDTDFGAAVIACKRCIPI